MKTSERHYNMRSIMKEVPIKDLFGSKQIKATGLRIKILNLFLYSHEPLSIEEICKRININSATAYRTVLLFEEIGFIRRVHVTEKKSASERKPAYYGLKVDETR